MRHIVVSILYGHFLLRDAWCDAGDDRESYRDSEGHVAGASTYQIVVRAPADPRSVGLELRVWGGEPEPDRGSWDECRQLDLHCPTGELLVEQITAGAAAEVALPQDAGVYGVRVHRSGYGDAQTFLVDLWWQTPLPPDDDDEDFYGDLP
ncbi:MULTISPECIES: hypothetical protein [unclassified Micromonospora]|uniref:hypothetical protein n=1 Tax=unclassified Micromonospora TaxID=2617518 RepID=UPI0010353E66|nr:MULTISPECIES: hypothetical protein [unclassified Micromonospora]QKW15858.1 hypothetical protein HUT12_25965 [Verrucosispora sp. NA02020]TBL39188.1 hypothetical protein EYA84_08705 [Verrucosispora sp. SN26_14.1]